MKITCSQFEGLISFYIDNELSESLKQAFELHLQECPNCSLKFKIIKSVICDIREAYSNYITAETNDYTDGAENNETDCFTDGCEATNLSAYIDNELSDENNIKIRRKILAKPKIRTKLEKMFKLKKLMSDSFIEAKSNLKTDFAKEIVRDITDLGITSEPVYYNCNLFFIVVVLALVISIWTIIHII